MGSFAIGPRSRSWGFSAIDVRLSAPFTRKFVIDGKAGKLRTGPTFRRTAFDLLELSDGASSPRKIPQVVAVGLQKIRVPPTPQEAASSLRLQSPEMIVFKRSAPHLGHPSHNRLALARQIVCLFGYPQAALTEAIYGSFPFFDIHSVTHRYST